MARPSRVRGIRPGRPLRENAAKVIQVRLSELLSWGDALENPAMVAELHNMRIAAKRLRYAFETFQICFPDVKQLLKDISAIQEDLGDIHDLDVLTDVVRDRLSDLEERLETESVEIMAMDVPEVEKSALLRRLSSGAARNIERLGLLGLLGDKVNERQRRFQAFRSEWGAGRLDELQSSVLQAIASAAGPDTPPQEPPLPTIVHTG